MMKRIAGFVFLAAGLLPLAAQAESDHSSLQLDQHRAVADPNIPATSPDFDPNRRLLELVSACAPGRSGQGNLPPIPVDPGNLPLPDPNGNSGLLEAAIPDTSASLPQVGSGLPNTQTLPSNPTGLRR
jgi:hypothetical protein